ncbi:MAG: ATP-binding protein, partial [Chloroflexota bacterium]
SDKRLNYALGLAQQANKYGTAIIRQDISAELGVDFLSAVSAPLIAEGQTMGAIFLASKHKRAFQNRHTELLNTMSHQIALAIRNAQLYVQLDQLAVLKEIFRLSREIHDGLAQTLAYLNLQTERLEGLIKTDKKDAAVLEASEMRRSIQSAYLEAREAIEGLRQELERPDQMVIRLTEYSQLFSQKTGIETRLLIEPQGLLVSPTMALQLLRIVQESLSNVRKHSKATRVDINVISVDEQLEISITDNGIGFPDVPRIDQLINQQHYGLTTMRERARNLGGDLTIATGAAQGTRISVNVPIHDNKKIMV